MGDRRRTEGRNPGYSNGSAGVGDLRTGESRGREIISNDINKSNSHGGERGNTRGSEREFRNDNLENNGVDTREKGGEDRERGNDNGDRGSRSNDRGSDRNNYNNDSGKDKKFRNTKEQCSLVIENISDTDSYKEFESEVRSYGLVSKLWINKRSRTCIMTYNEQDDTLKAMFKLKSMKWPKEGGELMKVRLLQNNEVSKTISEIQFLQGIVRPEQDKFKKESQLSKDDNDRQRHGYDKYDRYHDKYERNDNKYSKYDQQERNDRYDRSEPERYEKNNKYYRNEVHDTRHYEKYEKEERYYRQDRNSGYERIPNRERVRDERERYSNERGIGGERYKNRRTDSEDYQQPKYQPRANSNFYQTSQQPPVYYTVQPDNIVQSRQEIIDNYFDSDKKK